MSLFHKIGKIIIPHKLSLKLKEYITKTGRYDVPFSHYGVLFLGSLIASFIIYWLVLFQSLKTASFIFLLIGITTLKNPLETSF